MNDSSDRKAQNVLTPKVLLNHEQHVYEIYKEPDKIEVSVIPTRNIIQACTHTKTSQWRYISNINVRVSVEMFF